MSLRILTAMVMVGALGGCERPPPAEPAIAIDTAGLVRRIYDDQAERLTRREAEQDLDQLAALLEREHAYSALEAAPGGTEFAARVKAIRGALGETISRNDFLLQVSTAIAASGDAHAALEAEPLSAGAYAPFLCGWSREGLVAFKPDRRGFVDPERPILVSLDGVPVERWIEAAQRTIPRGAASMRRERAARALRYVGYVRRELGLPAAPAVELELAPAGGGEHARVSLLLAKECPRFGVWPPDGQFLTATDLVYLRIPEMTDDAAGKAGVWAARARGRRGLIIDVRGNGGGSRAVTRALIPLLMRPGSEPRVCNAAVPRLGPDQSPVRDLSDRWLYPASWADWTSAERGAIERFDAALHAEPAPDRRAFGPWHYFVVSGAPEGDPLPAVVVLMDGGCFSATDVFLAAAKGLPGVTLLGTPSSGGSGAARSIMLGQSGIRLRLSSMASYQPDGRLFDGRGVEPDVRVEPEPEDFLGAGDAAMFAARDRLLGR